MKQPPFLMWMDDQPKRTLAQKVADARAAYRQRFGCEATLILVSSDDAEQLTGLGVVDGVEVRVAANVRRNIVWAGQG